MTTSKGIRPGKGVPGEALIYVCVCVCVLCECGVCTCVCVPAAHTLYVTQHMQEILLGMKPNSNRDLISPLGIQEAAISRNALMWAALAAEWDWVTASKVQVKQQNGFEAPTQGCQ